MEPDWAIDKMMDKDGYDEENIAQDRTGLVMSETREWRAGTHCGEIGTLF